MGKNAQRRRVERAGRNIPAFEDAPSRTKSVTWASRAERRAHEFRIKPGEQRMRHDRAQARYRRRDGVRPRRKVVRTMQAIARREVRRAQRLAKGRPAA